MTQDKLREFMHGTVTCGGYAEAKDLCGVTK